MDIKIAPNSRTFIVGMTGSGKSYLANNSLDKVKRLVVFDTKGNLLKPMDLVKGTRKHWSEFLRGADKRIQVKDAPHGANVEEYFDEYCYRIRVASSCVVYIDEILDVIGMGGSNPTYNMRSLFSKGREPIKNEKGEIVSGNIGVVACTQRPSRVPELMKTEADNIFCFRLQKPEDRDTMAGYMGLKHLPAITDEHGFFYYNKTMTEPVYVKELKV